MILRWRRAVRHNAGWSRDRARAPRATPSVPHDGPRHHAACRPPHPTAARRDTTTARSRPARVASAPRTLDRDSRFGPRCVRWLIPGVQDVVSTERCHSCSSSHSVGCMYTPAEEVGLMGLRLATRVQHALDGIPPEDMVELMGEIRRTATDRHLAYQRHGVTETIRLLACPLTLRPDQLGYTHYVSETVLNCIK